jgi:hypothetical protein
LVSSPQYTRKIVLEIGQLWKWKLRSFFLPPLFFFLFLLLLWGHHTTISIGFSTISSTFSFSWSSWQYFQLPPQSNLCFPLQPFHEIVANYYLQFTILQIEPFLDIPRSTILFMVSNAPDSKQAYRVALKQWTGRQQDSYTNTFKESGQF